MSRYNGSERQQYRVQTDFSETPPPPFIWVRGKELFTGSQNKWVFLHLGCHHSGAIRCYVNSDWKTWTGIKGYEGKRLLRASHQRIGQKQHIKKCLKSQTREKKKKRKKQQRDRAGVLQQPDSCCLSQLNGNIMNICNCGVIIW